MDVYSAARNHWHPWTGVYLHQLQRASLSVQLNIAEGWTFSNSPSCTRHLQIAYGSAIESADIIEVLADTREVPEELIRTMRQHSIDSRRFLVGLLKRRRPLK